MPASCIGCSTESPPLAVNQSLPLRLLRVTVVVILVIAGAFAAGVVWYHAPVDKLSRGVLALAWFAFAVTCTIAFARSRDWRAIAALGVPFAAILTWFILIEPTNDRDWSPEMTRLLTYTRDGDIITVNNVRNFNWTAPKTATERWETRRYALSDLQGVDVLSLYWKGPRVAHTYFSFIWKDGEALSFSVEIRKERGEEYSPVAGFFKAYELTILAGDERDFYGWRIFFPKEDIQLFPTRATPEEAAKLLVELLDNANARAADPEFYNTLTENCTTEVWMLTDALGLGKPLDWRLFASGFLPDLLYDLKVLKTERPLAQLRAEGHILPRARDAVAKGLIGPDFSRAIRRGTP
jgi:hypothetical protein